MKRGTSSRNGRNKGIIGITDRNGSGSRDRGNRKQKRQRRSIRGVVIGDILELEKRRVISSRQGRREPHVVVHLNVEGRTERMWQR